MAPAQFEFPAIGKKTPKIFDLYLGAIHQTELGGLGGLGLCRKAIFGLAPLAHKKTGLKAISGLFEILDSAIDRWR